MHLVRSELRLEAPPHQSQQGALHSNRGYRLPLAVISTNTLRRDAGEDGDAPVDVWTVIRPGHVREKIAMFASEEEGRAGGGALTRAVVTALSRAPKAKGGREGSCSAKRRRRSGNKQNPQQDPRTRTEPQEEQKVSVGDMVAFLERRAGERPRRPPPLALQRSSASITLSKAPPPEPQEGPESPRVSDMVARLESEGGVSRSGSLRRAVGRVLLVQTQAPSETEAPPLRPEEAEPPPGLLFLSAPPPARPRPPAAPLGPPEEAGPARRRAAAASQDFLQRRLRLQRLLQPQPFLWALPHHLLLQVLRLLPTRSLAALQCTCSYFRAVLETYGVRPADSLWVSDPRYRDDPCKQCKRRYRRGDVSLCRWHHKPFCQALPGGPGYWMCCRGNRRDSPGCNVGLHDNRWVPAFHSIRRSSNHDD